MAQKNISPKQQTENKTSTKKRYASVDALRGFDMFWITGGAAFITAILKFFSPGVQEALIPQFHHVKWEGFRFYDLIFPLFVFVTGMSVVFSLQRIMKAEGKKAAYRRLIPRTILLFIFGIIYYHGIEDGFENIRLLGVLQRLALTYMFAGILFIHLDLKGMIIVFWGLILGYWALLSFVPIPGAEEISFTTTNNWAYWIDNNYLPLRKHFGEWDPEGILSTIPAIGTALLGVFAALIIKKDTIEDMKKVYLMSGIGIIMVIVGYIWGFQFPIIKKIWTSSYVLVAGGYSFFLLGLFFLVVDVWKINKWTIPFIWIGMNPITIYMVRNLLSFDHLAMRFVGGEMQTLFGETFGNFLVRAISLGFSLLLVRFLYKKKIFIRL